MKLQRSFLPIAFGTAVIGIFMVALPLLTWKGIVSVDQFTQMISLLLGWPTVVFVLVTSAFTYFSSGIDAFLKNIAKNRAVMKLPGGVEFQSLPTIPPVGAVDIKEGYQSEVESQEQIDTILKTLDDFQKLSAAERRRLEDLYRKSIQQAKYWKLSYLSWFFAPNTKRILHWFAKSPGLPRTAFHEAWQYDIPDIRQRDVILGVLFQYGMIEETDGLISVTSEGYAFLQFIGFTPMV